MAGSCNVNFGRSTRAFAANWAVVLHSFVTLHVRSNVEIHVTAEKQLNRPDAKRLSGELLQMTLGLYPTSPKRHGISLGNQGTKGCNRNPGLIHILGHDHHRFHHQHLQTRTPSCGERRTLPPSKSKERCIRGLSDVVALQSECSQFCASSRVLAGVSDKPSRSSRSCTMSLLQTLPRLLARRGVNRRKWV